MSGAVPRWLAAVRLSEGIATLRLRWLLEAHDRAAKSARDLVSNAATLLRQLQPPMIAPPSCPAIRHRGGHAQHRRVALKRRNIIRNRCAQR